MKKILSFFIVTIIFSLYFFTSFALAQSLSDQINAQIGAGAAAAEIGAAVPPQIIIAEIIKMLLTLMGTFFTGLVVYAGYLIFTARGEDDKVEKAQKTLRGAVIGLFIILMAYGITLLVGKTVQYATGGEVNQEQNIRVNCSVWNVIRGKGCDSIERVQ